MTYEEFLAENKEFIADLTTAEKIKFATAYEWGWPDKPTPEEAKEQAKAGCTPEKTEKRNEPGNLSFESEIGSMKFITKFAGLTPEEAQQLDEDIFTKNKVTPEIAKKIKSAFESKGIEKTVVEALRAIHDNWVGNHPTNFQKTTIDEYGTIKKRNKDYQFVDLRLMSFGNDGAKADLIFLRPILEACGLSIDMQKLEEEFFLAQQEFLTENGIYTKEDLTEFLRKGSISYKPLEGLKAGDLDGRPIDELLQEDEIVEHMADQVIAKSKIKLIDEKSLNNQELSKNDKTIPNNPKQYSAKDFEGMATEGPNLEGAIVEIQNKEIEKANDSNTPKNPTDDDPHNL